VTRKIVAGACRIADGSGETLLLGNIDVARDWGWAPEYVEAMWLMLQQDVADDYVVATGDTRTLGEFVEAAFKCVGLDWHDHVRSDPALFRPADIRRGAANPTKAKLKLGWQAKKRLDEVVAAMVKAEDRSNGQG
jgi:GDPmannose 4,6-dehydratase